MQPGQRHPRRGWLRRGARLAAVATVLLGAAAGAPAANAAGYQELYRPQFHFTPAQNWMNDPNGLVYYKGEYHLFYQHNPFGTTWGHMSWGHAVSRDLVHWQHLPVAIPEEGDEAIFSGSAVVDHQNTSGFGTRRNPPMVAIYTSARPGDQNQSLAYSTDRGRTWTKYAGNPVLDDADPRVPRSEGVLVRAGPRMADGRCEGPAAQGRDLPLQEPQDVDAPERFRARQRGRRRLGVPGPVPARGRRQAPQDQVGDAGQPQPGRDRRRLGHAVLRRRLRRHALHRRRQPAYTPPAGDVYADFEAADYGGWTASGTAFGSGPAHGALPGQQTVSGYSGGGLVNSFIDFDGSQGTLTSPEFTLTRDYVNFLVGGGAHAHDPAAGDGTPPPGTVLGDFEAPTYGAWTATGDFAGTAPHVGGDGRVGERSVDTFFGAQRDSDENRGTIESPTFTLDHDYLSFEVAGGAQPSTQVRLVVDGSVVRTASGHETGTLNWTAWNVADLRGKQARIVIADESTGGWGHILADHFVLGDTPAKIRSDETAVNLLVDGEVVRSTAGKESEALDWASWDVRALKGKQARIQIVDRNSGGWGHILADQFTFSDAAAQSSEQRAHWLDYGKDYYAAVTYNDEPDGRRIAIGWMSNWNYANATPTSPWRSAMAVPRELGLQTIDGRTQLVSEPVRELRTLRSWWPSYQQRNRTIPQGTTTLPARGKALEIDADLRLAGAKRAGLKVRTGNGQETIIGYDAESAEVYVDRTRSGESGFSRDFPGIQRAPLAARNGKVHLHILVDWSSVEVFADKGQTVITDQIFPAADSDGVQLFAEGGNARIDSLDIRPLRSSWTSDHRHEHDHDHY